MICGAHGSPGYSATEPTLSKRSPAGAALPCGVGFFVCAHPAIPARVAPAIIQITNGFFIWVESEPSRTLSIGEFLLRQFCAQDRLKNNRRNASANPGAANLCR